MQKGEREALDSLQAFSFPAYRNPFFVKGIFSRVFRVGLHLLLILSLSLSLAIHLCPQLTTSFFQGEGSEAKGPAVRTGAAVRPPQEPARLHRVSDQALQAPQPSARLPGRHLLLGTRAPGRGRHHNIL